MRKHASFNIVLSAAAVICAFLYPSLGQAATVAPVVTKISPMFGPTAGGTSVTITGSNFTVGATTVKFGAKAGTSVSCSSASHCTAISPARSGTVSVRVTNDSGTSADTAADDFTYTAPSSACSIFASAANYAVGPQPNSVAVGDFNDDGRSDLAVANTHSASVSILLGKGTGTFGGQTNFTVGVVPFSVAVGDFNGDSHSDLAVANLNQNTVSILLGSGTGMFGAKRDFVVGIAPTSVAVGDFNGDARSDLAVTNFGSNNVSILIGTGIGTFGAATNFAVGAVPWSVAVGDFNGDGRSDLAVANASSNNVSILLGTGTGTFGAATNFPVGADPRSLAIGDFNGDGRSDLVVANASAANVSILLGAGTGTFGVATNLSVGDSPEFVTVGDFNGDGKSDLAVANSGMGSNNISILLGTGTGAFGAATNFAVGTTPISVAIGDFNGDGRSDLAVANQALVSNTVSILLNTGYAPAVGSVGTTAVGTSVTIASSNFIAGASGLLMMTKE